MWDSLSLWRARKNTGNCEINSKLISMCAVWVRVQEQRTQGAALCSDLCSNVSQSLVLVTVALSRTEYELPALVTLFDGLLHFIRQLSESTESLQQTIGCQSDPTPSQKLFLAMKKTAVCHYLLSELHTDS